MAAFPIRGHFPLNGSFVRHGLFSAFVAKRVNITEIKAPEYEFKYRAVFQYGDIT